MFATLGSRTSSAFDSRSGSQERQRSRAGSTRYGSRHINPYNAEPFPLPQPPSRPRTTDEVILNKSSIIWRDFQFALKNRKRLINQLRQVACDEPSEAVLKRLLLEIRQKTLLIIEDALEMEYGVQLSKPVSYQNGLPSLFNFEGIQEKDDLNALCEIVTDMDDVPKIPAIKEFLPSNFPSYRNPFMLGKTVDELAALDVSQPEPGNKEFEMKMLELLRFKRASAALLRIETQLHNKMPLTLKDIERLWYRMHDDRSVDILIRCVCTIIANSKKTDYERVSELHYLSDPSLHLEPHDFLLMLNNYEEDERGTMKTDVKASIRLALQGCNMAKLKDFSCAFLVELIKMAVGSDCVPLGKLSPTRSVVSAVTSMVVKEDSGRQEDRHDGTILPAIGAKSQAIQRTPLLKRHKKGGLQRETSPERDEDAAASVTDTTTNKKGKDKPESAVSKPHKGDHQEMLALKYEMIKLQQELFRRGVLDPRHYTAGVDKSTLEKTDFAVLTEESRVVTTNAFGVSEGHHHHRHEHHNNHHTNNNAFQELIIRGKPFSWGAQNEKSGYIELHREVLTDTVIGLLFRLFDADHPADAPSVVPTTASSTAPTVRKELVHEMRFSKLMVNRVTGHQLESILESSELQRPQLFANLFTQIKNAMCIATDDTTMPISSNSAVNNLASLPYLVPTVDRTLYRGTLTTGDVAMKVAVTRDLDCSGITVQCSPLQPISDPNPSATSHAVTIHMTDKELQVLLINQRGLFTLAQSKYSSMEMIAQWITSRLRVKRIYMYEDEKEDESDGLDVTTAKFMMKEDTGVMVGTGVGGAGGGGMMRRIPTASRLISRVSSMHSMGSFRSQSSARLSTGGSKDHNHPSTISQQIALGPQFVDASHQNEGSLIDVSIDRSVEIPNDVKTQWRSRNFPSIPDATCTVSAWQDLEILCIEIEITLPKAPIRHSTSPGKSISNMSSQLSVNASTGGGVSEDLITIPLSYRLTGTELLIFGSSESSDSSRVHILTAGKGLHPSAFLWNILCRLVVEFKGSKSNPYAEQCSVADPNSWSIRYQRRLLRDVRTISGGVMVINASAIGGEILYESKPTDNSIYKSVGPKLITEPEITSLVLAEGWSVHLLAYERRNELISQILTKLKVIEDKLTNRLELYHFPETKLLQVVQVMGLNKQDFVIGTVEIDNRMTLLDLRVVMAHELDKELIPKQFRFLYKGNPCAARQEAIRKAWETLPKISILTKSVRIEKAEDKPDDSNKVNEEDERLKLLKTQKRLPKMAALPICTLVRVHEESTSVYTAHDIRGLINVGDIIRIGNITARDYLVVSLDIPLLDNQPIRSFDIEPKYEAPAENEIPLQGNCLYLPYESSEPLTTMAKKKKLPVYLDNLADMDPSLLGTLGNSDGKAGIDSVSLSGSSLLDDLLANDGFSKQQDDSSTIGGIGSGTDGDGHREKELLGNCWMDLWIWKCIPRNQDKRYKWQINYDNGNIPFKFEWQDSNEGIVYFRIFKLWSEMERLCRDNRCPNLTIYTQRFDEMKAFTIDFYTSFIFRQMCNWYPLPSQADVIEVQKWMKLIKEAKIFPDMKTPRRSAMIEALFAKEVKTFGIADKYITYAGFVRILQQCAVMRYPQNKEPQPGDVARGKIRKSGASPPKKDLSALNPSKVKDSSTVEDIADDSSVKSNNKSKKEGKDVKRGVAPPIDPVYADKVLNRMVADYIMNIRDWATITWEDAKRKAMDTEAQRHCGVTRLSAKWRGGRQHYLYKRFLWSLIKLQAHIRRRIQRARHRSMLQNLRDDWMFRVRYYYASIIQSGVRRFIMRCRYIRILTKTRQTQLAVAIAKRENLRKLRQRQRKGVMFKQIRSVNGIMVLIRVHRKDQRVYSKDLGLIIEVYAPKWAESWKFTLEEQTVRDYMEEIVGKQGLSMKEILDIDNLEKLISMRLICRESVRAGRPPRVNVSTQSLGQRGIEVMTRGIRCGKELFVCTLYERASDVTALCYHRHTSKLFECTMLTSAVHDWVTSVYYAKSSIPQDKRELPPILKPENKTLLRIWLMNHIVIDTRHGIFKVLFHYQYVKSRKLALIIKVQSHWRRVLTRIRMLQYIDTYIVLVKTPDGGLYYLNLFTGETSWDKPAVLQGRDLPSGPYFRWERLWYMTDTEMYIDPSSGRFSTYSVELAAKRVTSVARNYLIKPFRLSLQQFKKGKSFAETIEAEFKRHPNKLGNIVNYALLAHAIQHNYARAKQLYLDAMRLSDSSPLVARAWGIFLLSHCEAPVAATREKAIKLLKDSRHRDPNASKFETACNCFFKYTLLCYPDHSQALLDMALIYFYVYADIAQAEKLLRRAVFLAPFDDKIVTNWQYLEPQFLNRNSEHILPRNVSWAAESSSLGPATDRGYKSYHTASESTVVESYSEYNNTSSPRKQPSLMSDISNKSDILSTIRSDNDGSSKPTVVKEKSFRKKMSVVPP